MEPAPNVVFAKETPQELKKNKFEYVNQADKVFEVTAIGEDVTRCKVGDFIIFRDSQEFTFKGDSFHVVEESDIRGVAHV